MKQVLFLFIFATLIASCGNAKKGQQAGTVSVISDSLRFCESTLCNNDALLIANFGTAELNPLNNEGKGYIVEYRDGKIQPLIPADGTLSGPKGMGVKDGYLFICDVNKMVVYNLNEPENIPFVLMFPDGEVFVNDIIFISNKLYVSVTNTGNIYTLDVAVPADMASKVFEPYVNVPGANGMVTDGEKIYIASYPPDGVTKDENVIYVINDVEVPQPEKLIDRVGQYDGLALSADGKTLYFTSWVNGEIGKVDLATKEVVLLPVKEQLTGPADMTLHDGKLYIPDLPNSKVVIVETNE